MVCKNYGAQAAPQPDAGFPEKVRSTARKVGSSPLFLAATLCYTLILLLGLAGALSLSCASNNIFDLYTNNLREEMGITLSFDLSMVFLITCLMGMLPMLFIAIGLWITFGSCAGHKPKVNTAGLAMIFVTTLIQLVLTTLLFLGSLAMLAVMYCNASSIFGKDAEIMKTALLVDGVILLLVFSFVLFCFIKLCTTVANIRNTLQTGIPNKKVSRLVGVLCCIGSALAFFFAVESILTISITTMDAFNHSAYGLLRTILYLSVPAFLLITGMLILFGALIFSYRSKMAELETESRLNAFKTLSYAAPYTSPVYIPPQPETKEENL